MTALTAELRASLEAHSATFDTLLRLIPPKYYLPSEAPENPAALKYQKNVKKQNNTKQEVKERSKKARRDKLNPANHKSILELQEEAAEQEEPPPSALSKGKRKATEIYVAEAADDDATLQPMPADTGIQELRAKLHARMADMRRKRGIVEPESSPTGKDALLEERRQQRAALRERRRKETKAKIRAEKAAKANKKSVEGQTGKTARPVPVQSQLIVPDSHATVTFSTIADPSSSSSKKHKPNKHSATASNPTQALAQLEARKQRLAALPSEKREAAEEADGWARVEARLDGEKFRDDAAKLKKSVKRKEKEKVKSKKEWDARKEQIQTAQAAKQKKRTDNIAKRLDSGKKKSKGRPGFEGKTFGRRKK